MKTALRFLDLVTGENIFIVHDVCLDSFPLIACFGLELWEPLQSELAGALWNVLLLLFALFSCQFMLLDLFALNLGFMDFGSEQM